MALFCRAKVTKIRVTFLVAGFTSISSLQGCFPGLFRQAGNAKQDKDERMPDLSLVSLDDEEPEDEVSLTGKAQYQIAE